MFRSGSTTENLDLTNITPFSPALCLGLIDNISNLLLHHFLLMAKHYICSCKLRNTFRMLHAAFDDNNLASFKNKWATFKQISGMQPSCVCYCTRFVDFVLPLFFLFFVFSNPLCENSFLVLTQDKFS